MERWLDTYTHRIWWHGKQSVPQPDTNSIIRTTASYFTVPTLSHTSLTLLTASLHHKQRRHGERTITYLRSTSHHEKHFGAVALFLLHIQQYRAITLEASCHKRFTWLLHIRGLHLPECGVTSLGDGCLMFHVMTTWWSHLQSIWPLKKWATCCHEMLGTSHPVRWRHFLDKWRPQVHHCTSLTPSSHLLAYQVEET